MLKAIIFDFNGVIADDEPIHYEMFARVLAEEGISFSREEYYRVYLGMDDRGCFCNVLAAHRRIPDTRKIEWLIARKAYYYRQAIEKGLILFPGVVEFVKKASIQYILAIASGALRSEIDLILTHAGIKGEFSFIVSAEDVEKGKPDPSAFLETLRRINHNTSPPLSPGECLVIEDSVPGIEAAHAAGMKCLAVAHTYPAEELRSADLVIPGIGECRLEMVEGLFES